MTETVKWQGAYEIVEYMVTEQDDLPGLIDRLESPDIEAHTVICRQGGGPAFYVTDVNEEGIYGFYLDNII